MIRVVLVTRFPREVEQPQGGIESVSVALAQALAARPELDVHVLAFDQTCDGVRKMAGIMEHRLLRSKCPQIVDVFIGPGQSRLRRYLRVLAPDVIHAHETWGLGLGGFEIPTILTVHGFDHENLRVNGAKATWLRAPIWKWMTCWGLQKQRQVVSITPYVRQTIQTWTHAKIYDIENPIDRRFFLTRSRSEAARVLCVGWIDARKNTLGSIQAFARATRGMVGCRLVIAGEAKEPRYLTRVLACISELGLEDRVELLGHLNRERLLVELSRASVFLLPSLQENAPMAIAEAMAAGVPVIASNRCGIPYMIRDRVTGILVDPENMTQVGNELRWILRHDFARAEMGRAARVEAKRRFHPDRIAEQTVAMYRAVLQDSKPLTSRLSEAVGSGV